MKIKTLLITALMAGSTFGFASMLHAEMVLSQVIVDLLPGQPPREDIEVWNSGSDRIYVSAEPSEILDAGTPQQKRIPATNPDAAGILVSPRRLVLEPGERRAVRISLIGERPHSDRIYRVAIKPVVGPVSAENSAIKLLVGYDALVIARPTAFTGKLDGARTGKVLTITNASNTSQELFDGRQCDSSGANCKALPAKRLYSGTRWQQTLPFDTKVTYSSAIGQTVQKQTF